MKCPNCKERPAIVDATYGVAFCDSCQDKEESFSKPKLGHEFTTVTIRDERKEFSRDILQPWHGGVLSKEYVEEYGTAGIEATKEQVENARYTNKSQKGWWNRKRGKGGGGGRKSDKTI